MMTTPSLESLAHMRVAICALARDCARHVHRNLRLLHAVTRYFKEVEFYIVENNSTDNTRKYLQYWKEKSPHVVHLPDIHAYITTLDGVTVNFDRSKDIKTKEGIYAQRVARMAIARDCYLDYVQKSGFHADFILMCDLDVFGFSVKGILSSFLSTTKWDVVTANGVLYRYTSLCSMPRLLYYDSFALDVELPRDTDDVLNTHLQESMTDILMSDQWVPVNSAFGGLGIYAYDAIYSHPRTYYLTEVLRDTHRYCEHISFHRALRKKGISNIYIHRDMHVYYNTMLRGYMHYILSICKLR